MYVYNTCICKMNFAVHCTFCNKIVNYDVLGPTNLRACESKNIKIYICKS